MLLLLIFPFTDTLLFTYITTVAVIFYFIINTYKSFLHFNSLSHVKSMAKAKIILKLNIFMVKCYLNLTSYSGIDL